MVRCGVCFFRFSGSTGAPAATIGKSAGELDRAIQQLDAKLHTLGLIHLLSARVGMAFDDVNEFVASVQRLFLQGSVEQGRMEAKRCVRISHKLVQLATEYQMPMRGALVVVAVAAVVSHKHAHICAHSHYMSREGDQHGAGKRWPADGHSR